MTHLNIQQGSNVEIVSAQIIKKLYDTALTVSEPLEGETDAAYMSGNLQVNKASRKACTYLTTRFPNLHINVTGDYYIDFEDSILGNRLISLCSSDGVGVTETDAANVTFTQQDLNDLKNDVTSFNEFGYFTKANSNYGNYNSRFRDFKNLTSIDLTNLQCLRYNDFRNTGITTVNAPSLIWVYGNGNFAFQDCTSLTTVQSFGSITFVPESCFRGCTSLTTFPFDNITEIRDSAFRDCTNLTTINSPSLTSLSGNNIFNGCTNLTTVTSLGSITSIPTNTFRDCTSLSSINIPSTVTSYGESSLRGCTSLYATIDLTGVTNIGVEPFVGSNVSFTGNTSSITTLGNGAFKNSRISGNLSFPSLTNIGSQVFSGCSNIQSIDFTGSTITSIPYHTFRDCSSLSKITIPTTVTQLGEQWYYGTSRTLTLEGFDNISSHSPYNYTIDNKTITNPVKVSYSDDDSILLRLSGNNTNASINQLYEPLRTSTKNGFIASNYTNNTMYTYNVSSGSGMISFGLLYYRDIISFGNKTFFRCIIDNLVINNVTPPTFTPNADESSSIWMDKIFPTGNSTASENVVVGTLWVPDSAVATYQANSLYSHLNIKGINTKTNGTDYDLPRYATYAAWKTAEETAVAQNSHAPVGLIEAWM